MSEAAVETKLVVVILVVDVRGGKSSGDGGSSPGPGGLGVVGLFELY